MVSIAALLPPTSTYLHHGERAISFPPCPSKRGTAAARVWLPLTFLNCCFTFLNRRLTFIPRASGVSEARRETLGAVCVGAARTRNQDAISPIEASTTEKMNHARIENVTATPFDSRGSTSLHLPSPCPQGPLAVIVLASRDRDKSS